LIGYYQRGQKQKPERNLSALNPPQSILAQNSVSAMGKGEWQYSVGMAQKDVNLLDVRPANFVPGQDFREDTAGFDVGGHPVQQLAVHRRAHARADLALQVERPHQAAVAGGAHWSSSSSPARTTSNAPPRASGNETDSSSSQCS